MIDLLLEHTYVYIGDKLNVVFYDTAKPSTVITFSVSPQNSNNICDGWTVTTDENGYIYTSCDITQSIYSQLGTVYTLTATGGTVSKSADFKVDYSGVLIARGMETLLQAFQNVPVYDEPAVIRALDSVTYATYTYKPWTTDTQFLLFRRETEDLTLFEDVFPDFINGRVLIKTSYQVGDDYYGTYKFRFFSEDEWYSYLQLSLDEINGLRPVTSFDFNSMPNYYDAALIIGAYRKCLMRLLTDIEFWNSRLIFPEPTGLRGTLQSLLTSATTEYLELKKTAKRRGLVKPVGLTSYKATVPRLIDGLNYRLYTLASISVPSQY